MSAKVSAPIVNMSSADAPKTVKKVVAKKAAAPAPAAAAASASAPAAEPKAAKAPRKAPAAKTEVVVPTVAAPEVAVPAETSAPASITSVVERLREVRTRIANELKEIIADTLLAAKTAAREVKDAKRKRRVKKDVADMTPEEQAAAKAARAATRFSGY